MSIDQKKFIEIYDVLHKCGISRKRDKKRLSMIKIKRII